MLLSGGGETVHEARRAVVVGDIHAIVVDGEEASTGHFDDLGHGRRCGVLCGRRPWRWTTVPVWVILPEISGAAPDSGVLSGDMASVPGLSWRLAA